MASEIIFEWPQAVASGDNFSTTICDSWENLKYAGILDTLKHGMKELLDYHLAGIEASTFTPRPTASQIAWMEANYTGENVYNLLKENLRSQTGHENDNLDDYILCKMYVELGYVTSGYSGDGLRISHVVLIKASDLVDSITYPTAATTSSETISGYQGANKTVYQYELNRSQAVYSNYVFYSFGQPSSSASWGGGPFNSYLRMTQGFTKTQRGGYFGSNRWAYESEGYFSALNVISRDIYNPSGTSNSTSGKYPSTEMGGLGTFDDHTDLSDISSKPTLNIADLGFFSIWNPTPGELKNLADFVWNDPTDWQQWPQIFQSGILKPLDYIISLSLLPIPSSALTLANKTFCMGGIVFDGRAAALLMNLSMNQVQEQFVDINLGTLSLKEYFGSFLDYAPYSQISIYLPFYGVAELSMNELQNADSIELVYRINILDGSCAIKLLVDRQTSAAQNGSIPLKHVLYEYYTNVKTDIPLTQGANTEHLKMAATMITAAVAMAAPIAGAGAAALAGGVGTAASGAATMGDIMGSASAAAAANGGKIAAGIQAGAQGAQKIVNAMPSGGGMQRGNISGMSTGLLSERRPFLIVTRPIQVLPEGYKEEMGYTASIKTTLATLGSGFVKFDSVDLSSLDCEESERLKILDLLTNTGVYI